MSGLSIASDAYHQLVCTNYPTVELATESDRQQLIEDIANGKTKLIFSGGNEKFRQETLDEIGEIARLKIGYVLLKSITSQSEDFFVQQGSTHTCKMKGRFTTFYRRPNIDDYYLSYNPETREHGFKLKPSHATSFHEYLHLIDMLRNPDENLRRGDQTHDLLDPHMDNLEEQRVICGLLNDKKPRRLPVCENVYLKMLGLPYRLDHRGVIKEKGQPLTLPDLIRLRSIKDVKEMLNKDASIINQFHQVDISDTEVHPLIEGLESKFEPMIELLLQYEIDPSAAQAKNAEGDSLFIVALKHDWKAAKQLVDRNIVDLRDKSMQKNYLFEMILNAEQKDPELVDFFLIQMFTPELLQATYTNNVNPLLFFDRLGIIGESLIPFSAKCFSYHPLCWLINTCLDQNLSFDCDPLSLISEAEETQSAHVASRKLDEEIPEHLKKEEEELLETIQKTAERLRSIP